MYSQEAAAAIETLNGYAIKRRLPRRLLRLEHVLVRGVAGPVVRHSAFTGTKRISAMIRVKNEEEFLRPAVMSIMDAVDEVVLIDNLSTDGTAQIISELVAWAPDKFRGLQYPHAVARYGEENLKLASTARGRRSPRLLANFYNWCVEQCTHEFILKWDGDTVATHLFREKLAEFRESPQQALWITGVNLHSSRGHLIRVLPNEPIEPRLVYRRFSKYTNRAGYCESLTSPYIGRFNEYSDFVDDPSYIHLKYCKTSRYQHMSTDLQAMVADYHIDEIGEPVSDGLRSEIEEWGLNSGSSFSDDQSSKVDCRQSDSG